MPIIRESDAPQEGGDHPDLGPHDRVALGDAGDLTQIGVALESLPPGSASSELHWHSDEDEAVYLLDGELVLVEGDRETPMQAGDAATFKAGEPVGHRLENRGQSNARYLVVGTRARADVVTYPLSGRVKHRDLDGMERWTDLDGRPLKDRS